MSDRPAIPEIVIADRLRKDIAFHGIVKDRIFFMAIPEGRGVAFPTVIIRLVSGEAQGEVEDRGWMMSSDIECFIIDDQYNRAKLVANRAFAALHDFSDGSVTPPIKRCSLSSGGESDEAVVRQDGTLIYGITQTYTVLWER